MCGASSQQNQIEASQQSFYNTMTSEAQSVFGENQALYKNLVSAFEPILNAGPNQEGFSAPEKANLETEATEGTASNYQKAAAAVRESGAAAGGGNELIPSGENEQLQSEVANAAAQTESTEKQQIEEADYATGRQNWLAADAGLSGAGSVFNPSTAIAGEATGAGTAASNTANEIAQENNSWLGVVGGLAGNVISENPKGIFS